MSIHIENTELNRDYLVKGKHHLELSFHANSDANSDDTTFLLRSQNPDLLVFIEHGEEKKDFRFKMKLHKALQVFTQNIVVKQLDDPVKDSHVKILISCKNQDGATASDKLDILCK